MKMLINFKLFAQLYVETQQYNDMDVYIAERGWQDWMNDYSEDQVVYILKTIYQMAKMSFTDLRTFGGYSSRVSFCDTFKIPVKTVQKWDYEVSSTADYTKMFIAYILFIKADKEAGDEQD